MGIHKKIKKLTQSDVILDSVSDGIFTVDLDWHITSFNQAAEQISGVKRNDTLGMQCSDIFRSSMCGKNCALRQTLETGKPIICKSGYIINAKGNRLPISVSTSVIRDEEGRVIGGVETIRDLSDIEALRRELEGRFQVGEIASHSPLMQRVIEVLPVIAASQSTVLILGETGTGKELMARTIHSLSSRREGPLVAINCGALPDTLLESELFGYKAGAFTGAVKDKPGRFAQANGGTLFLDEIGEVSQALQVRLLRVLQERVYEPLGSIRSEKADVRFIVATNKDLAEQMRKGEFREDLYYRINVVRVEIPPLRRRKEDIPSLVDQFIKRFNSLQGKSVQGISIKALSLLMAYDWPGNVRELENMIERSFILCREGFIDIEHLPEELTAREIMSGDSLKPGSAHDLIDAQAIHLSLERNQYNRTAAARELGIHKTTLFRRIKKLGIILPEKNGRSTSKKRH
jgi:PAS domain S-box-containing protein